MRVLRTIGVSLSAFSAFSAIAALAAASGGDRAPAVLTLTYPGLEWCLTVHPGLMKLDGKQIRGDGKGAMLAASHEARNLRMTIYLEKESHAKNGQSCRDHYWTALKKNPPQEEDIKMSERGDVAIVEYTLNEPAGHSLHQRNLNAYLAKDGSCIDIHLSKDQYEREDHALFDDVVKSAAFRGLDSVDHMGLASWFYIKEDYRSAIAEYRKSLDLEEKAPRLEKNEWRVAVDNMGMAYGISGDLTRAKEMFEYGLSKEPEYPMFSYNLACTYGEMNDLDNAIVNLKKALQYKANMIPGETLPDPGKDTSFERFRKNPKFQEIVGLFRPQ